MDVAACGPQKVAELNRRYRVEGQAEQPDSYRSALLAFVFGGRVCIVEVGRAGSLGLGG